MPHTALFFRQQLTFSSHNDLPVNADAPMDVYLFNSNTIASEQITALAAQYLQPQEQSIFTKRKQLQAKQEYLASRFIIKTYASQYFGYDFDSLTVLFDDKDTCLKVYQHGQAIALRSCISHSHGQVLIALVPSQQSAALQSIQLGVDLEWLSTKRSLEKVAKHYYHSEELRACMAQTEYVAEGVTEDITEDVTEKKSKAVHAKALYRIWTLKEALAKAIKQPIATLLRDNVFEHCQSLNVRSGRYEALDKELDEVPSGVVSKTFDISIISDIELTDDTHIQILTNTLVDTVLVQ
ncbi:4'-phosphopantetheinyl transferase family protein [Moritella dasanensis]|uniref:4'-phosphopantetheinyl transferase family protein n=1 Tax=Moritella dasanensis TaxID=428031 RepID=UPI0002FE3A0E|nr:4'-phosphopantetheinyl transferase superfamily protein [Moritella dasanensis]